MDEDTASIEKIEKNEKNDITSVSASQVMGNETAFRG